jgi:uncharacterized protein (TIGR02757 family)
MPRTQRSIEIKKTLDAHYEATSPERFIENDPLSIPHAFSKKEDAEIAAFLTATLSWGQRNTIIRSALDLMERMEGEPHRFLLEASPSSIERIGEFRHRTFKTEDLQHFLKALKKIYEEHGGMHELFREGVRSEDEFLHGGVANFRSVFFSIPHSSRTEKHVADPYKGSPSKRLNMFLRWMVRNDAIDPGWWSDLGPHRLSCPLDLHSAKVARRLGLIQRKQNDGKTVRELDRSLRAFDPEDPVKYDIALHRMGVEDIS